VGALLAVLLPDELRQDDRARAALIVVGDAVEALLALAPRR
jgi:hypothetical protein